LIGTLNVSSGTVRIHVGIDVVIVALTFDQQIEGRKIKVRNKPIDCKLGNVF